MAYIQNGTTETGEFGLVARFRKLRDVLQERAARRAVYNRTLRELQSLSDRELADFGFHRSELPRLARQAAAEA